MAVAPFEVSAEEFLRLGPEQFGLEGGHEAVGLSAALSLLGKQGCTVPFVARYRRDVTGGLDAVALEALERAHDRFCKLTAEKNRVVKALADKAPQLAARGRRQLAAATNTDEVRAVALELGAVEAGGGERSRFARAAAQCPQLLAAAQRVLSAHSAPGPAKHEKLLSELRIAAQAVEASEWQLAANDVLAHLTASDEDVNAPLRALYWDSACVKVTLRAGKRTSTNGVSRASMALVGYGALLRCVEHHKWMAISRGMEAKELSLTIEPRSAESWFLGRWQQRSVAWPAGELRRLVLDASADAWKRLVRPALERRAKRRLTLAASEACTAVFARNLRDLLRSPGLGAHKVHAQAVVIGVDPGYAHGCKCAAVAANGAVLGTCVFTARKRAAAVKELGALARAHGATIFAVGNGTGAAEATAVVAELCRPPLACWYVLVNEAGASVYSVSAAARAELPHLDPLLIGAVSIARRLQDPLCELVKYEPSSLGVGQYQKDLPEKALAEALGRVLDTTVSLAGVDVNRAPAAVLARVAGLGPARAAAIRSHVEAQGAFATRAQLLDVAGIGPKTFRDAAGFLRVEGGPEPLDATAVHPDDYAIARRLLRHAGLAPTAATDKARLRASSLAKLAIGADKRDMLVAELLLGLGEADPRDGRPPPTLRNEPLIGTGVKPRQGLLVTGVVRNVTDFGAFIDFGAKDNGLLHERYIRGRAHDYALGDVLECVVDAVRSDGKVSLRLPRARDLASAEVQRPSTAPSMRATGRCDDESENSKKASAKPMLTKQARKGEVVVVNDDVEKEEEEKEKEEEEEDKQASAKRARKKKAVVVVDDDDSEEKEEEDDDDRDEDYEEEEDDDDDDNSDDDNDDNDDSDDDERVSAKCKSARRHSSKATSSKAKNSTGGEGVDAERSSARRRKAKMKIKARRASAEQAKAAERTRLAGAGGPSSTPSSARKRRRPADDNDSDDDKRAKSRRQSSEATSSKAKNSGVDKRVGAEQSSAERRKANKKARGASAEGAKAAKRKCCFFSWSCHINQRMFWLYY